MAKEFHGKRMKGQNGEEKEQQKTGGRKSNGE